MGNGALVAQAATSPCSQTNSDMLLGGRYRILRCIGSGASGSVFEAIDTLSNGRRVAVKTILASTLDDEDVAESEIRIHRTLNHANCSDAAQTCHFLSQYIDSFSTSDCADSDDVDSFNDEGSDTFGYTFGQMSSSSIEESCIVTEFCDGGALADVVKYVRAGPLGGDGSGDSKQRVTEEEMADLCASMILGLSYMHSNLVIHRDIKSDNVLLTKRGQCKLVDFGISAAIKSQLGSRPSCQTLCGTPAFMAPEVITSSSSMDLHSEVTVPADSPATSPCHVGNRKPHSFSEPSVSGDCAGYSSKADIWSVGITAIELADGVAPANRKAGRWNNPYFMMNNIAQQPAPQLSSDNSENWSPVFHDFLRCCLQKDPQQRRSAAELVQHPFIAEACERLQSNNGCSERIQELVNRMLHWKKQMEIAAKAGQGKRRRRTSSSSQCSESSMASYEDAMPSWKHTRTIDSTFDSDSSSTDSGTLVLIPTTQTQTLKNTNKKSPTSVLAPVELLRTLKFQPIFNL